MDASEARAKLAGLRILIVEDVLFVADSMQAALETFGCKVVGPVPRLQRAMRMIERREIDGAILDVNLDGEWVFPVADALRKRRIPFIFATGYEEDDIPAEYRGYPRLEKPVGIARLAAAMVSAFSGQGNAVV